MAVSKNCSCTKCVVTAASGRVPGWRELEVSKISDLVVLDETFAGSRAAGYLNHKPWDVLFARVR